MSEQIGSPYLNLRVKYEEAFRDAKKAGTALQATFESSNKKIERAQERAIREIQRHIDRISGKRASDEINLIAHAVDQMGGRAKLSGEQITRLRQDVERLAAAGAKVPKTLEGIGRPGAIASLRAGAGQEFGRFASSVPGGGLLASIGPGGLAAAAGLGAFTVAAGAAVKEIAELGRKAEAWSNMAETTGLGVKEVQQLTYYLEDAGIETTALEQAAKAMHREIGTGGKRLQQFGIDVKTLANLSPSEQFRKLAASIMEIGDANQRGAAAQAAFGDSGERLIPVLSGIADGAHQMYDAFSDDEIAQMKKADEALDTLSRKWDFFKGKLAVGAVEAGQFATSGGFWKTVAAYFTGGYGAAALTGAEAVAGGVTPPPPKPPAEAPPSEDPAKRAARIAREKREEADRQAKAQQFQALLDQLSGKKAQEEMDQLAEAFQRLGLGGVADLEALRKKLEQLQAQGAKVKDTGLLALMGGGKVQAPKLDVSGLDLGPGGQVLDVTAVLRPVGLEAQKQFNEMAAAARKAGLSTEEISDALKTAGASTDQAKAAIDGLRGSTTDWRGELQDLANLMEGMGGLTGTVGKVLSGVATAISGIASYVEKLKAGAGGGLGQKLGGLFGGGGLLGKIAGDIGKAVPFLGLATSALGLGKSLWGGLKSLFGGDQAKKDAKEAGQILGREVSKETAKELRKEAEAAGLSFSEYVKKLAREEEAQKKSEQLQQRQEGLATARAGAEALLQALEEGGLSDKLSAALGDIVAKVGDALLKSGMGVLDPRLQKSEEFQRAQGIAGNVGTVLQGMRQAGMVDQGLLSAAGASAEELKNQAVEAALQAGLSDKEAQKAGFGAISALLREQLNASLQSGKELDENTKRLLEEAKANGIEIMADPMIELLAVNKKQLGALESIAGKPFTGVTAQKGLQGWKVPNVGGGLGPMIQPHAGELVWVLPAHMAGRGAILHAARGLFGRSGEELPGPDREPRDGGGAGGGEGPGGTGAGGGGAGAGAGPGVDEVAAAVERNIRTAIRGARPVNLSIQFNPNEDPLATKERKEDLRKFTIDQLNRVLKEREPSVMLNLRRALDR